MTNMPRDVGTQIFKEILSSSPPNPIKMKRELDEFEKKIVKERRKAVSGDCSISKMQNCADTVCTN